ncbi:MAG TPA: hypothetical protein VGH38_10190 [Bryobacteraceae bacterium]|jgi:hypothetical protein
MSRDEFLALMQRIGICRRTAESTWEHHSESLQLVSAKDLNFAFQESVRKMPRTWRVQ